MTAIVGRGVKVEVALTFAAAIAITSMSQAKPGVATKTAHGLNNKAVGYFDSVTGMVNLEGQAARVANKTNDTFELENINTTNYPAFTAGNFTPVATWGTLSNATSYSIGGGQGDALDSTTLLDDIKQEVQGLLAAQSVSFNLNSATINDSVAAFIEDAARNQSYCLFRITLKDGNVRVFRGQPSLAGEDVQKGAIGTGSFDVKVKGFVTQGAA